MSKRKRNKQKEAAVKPTGPMAIASGLATA